MMFLLLLAAAAGGPSKSVHPAWMVGTWGWQNPGEHDNDCGTDHDTTYHRNGRYDFMDETGTWRIEGDRLIETMTDPGGTGDPASRGRPYAMRFKRIGPGVLRILGPHPGKMTKCPGG
jgi:hypothetical protein